MMWASKRLFLALFFVPVIASAHNFVQGERVLPLAISDRGEMLLDNDEVRYQNWDSTQLEGKVRIVQYIAGRRSAKKKNSFLIKAIKSADFPDDRFQPTTIVNTDDEIPGTGIFVRSKIEKNKRHYPWAQFIIDSDGLGRKTWQLKEDSSTIFVLDQEGRIQWAKDGALTPNEVYHVIMLLRQLIKENTP